MIGDIHGHAGPLERLLKELGYTVRDGVYRHPSRMVVFAGDFVDRGPEQKAVLGIARSMVEEGSARAVLGNHELNAIAWSTPDGNGGYLRPHTSKNQKQHRAFLEQVDDGTAEYERAIGWFRTLPLWLDFGGLRIVHACWHEPSQEVLAGCLDVRNCLTDAALLATHDRRQPAFSAAEVLLKGPEVRLPNGGSFHDKDGHLRHEARLRWWDANATTYRTGTLGMEGRESELPDEAVPAGYAYTDTVPVLFGHYWMHGEPRILQPNASCLDFSVARGGYLTAYRWSGEASLEPGNLVWVAGN